MNQFYVQSFNFVCNETTLKTFWAGARHNTSLSDHLFKEIIVEQNTTLNSDVH